MRTAHIRGRDGQPPHKLWQAERTATHPAEEDGEAEVLTLVCVVAAGAMVAAAVAATDPGEPTREGAGATEATGCIAIDPWKDNEE